MRKVLVTGADGFIGSHLAERLVLDGMKVRALCCYNSFNSNGWLDTLDTEIKDNIEIFLGDVRDPVHVRQIVKGIDTVFHLAALIGIPYSYHATDSYVDTNIKGTLNVLQAARELSVKRVLVTSTSEVYGTALRVPIDEGHPKQGQSPYSATKIAADAMSEAFFKSFNLPVVTVRPFNTYGPRQSARAVIPAIITQALSGADKISLGNITPTRDLVFVADVVEGFVRIASSDNVIGEAINIATGSEYSVKEVAEKISGIIGRKITINKDPVRVRPEGSEVERLVGSNDKLYKLTGWRPGTSIDEGLRITVDWFKRDQKKCPNIYGSRNYVI
ncbi:MAG: SDR family NAD(P)-dependent oxidoreductase [Candidatus Omnitrophica bacterium]|nr:SDR family NAD(P)-dependent oxidoreductase [Candidatus Omnitrophota bacterium]